MDFAMGKKGQITIFIILGIIILVSAIVVFTSREAQEGGHGEVATRELPI